MSFSLKKIFWYYRTFLCKRKNVIFFEKFFWHYRTFFIFCITKDLCIQYTAKFEQATGQNNEIFGNIPRNDDNANK